MVTSPPPSDLIGPGVATPGVSHRPLSAEPDPAAVMTVFWEAGLPVAQALTGSDGVTRRTAPAKRRIRLSLSPQPPSVSVVICTRDRPEELRRCLASLPAQTLRPLEGELLVQWGNGAQSQCRAPYSLPEKSLQQAITLKGIRCD